MNGRSRLSIHGLYGKQPKIEHFFLGKVADHDDAEDLVQDVLYILVKRLDTLRKPESLDSWIYSICRNRLKQYYTEKSRRRTESFVESGTQDDCFEKIDIDILIRKLPERLQTMYILYFKQRLKIREIGVLLGKPEGTIKYLLYDLRRRLKEELGDRADHSASGNH